MAPKRMAVVEADGNVDNVILIEDGADWTPPEGMSLVDADHDAEPGGNYPRAARSQSGGAATGNRSVSLEERVAALAADVEALKSLRIR